MAANCAACTEGDPHDPNGPLMGELDCLVELMVLEDMDADELVCAYGPLFWRLIK